MSLFTGVELLDKSIHFSLGNESISIDVIPVIGLVELAISHVVINLDGREMFPGADDLLSGAKSVRSAEKALRVGVLLESASLEVIVSGRDSSHTILLLLGWDHVNVVPSNDSVQRLAIGAEFCLSWLG